MVRLGVFGPQDAGTEDHTSGYEEEDFLGRQGLPSECEAAGPQSAASQPVALGAQEHSGGDRHQRPGRPPRRRSTRRSRWWTRWPTRASSTRTPRAGTSRASSSAWRARGRRRNHAAFARSRLTHTAPPPGAPAAPAGRRPRTSGRDPSAAGRRRPPAPGGSETAFWRSGSGRRPQAVPESETARRCLPRPARPCSSRRAATTSPR